MSAGLNDTIGVNVWLPLKDENWNGRFLGQGGLGWVSYASFYFNQCSY